MNKRIRNTVLRSKQAIHSLAICFVFCSVVSVQAVVIATGDGAGNTVPPQDDPGFANVGNLNAGTATYLGNRWVMSAAHVRVGPVDFSGQSYAYDPGQVIQLNNPQDIELSPEDQEEWTELTDILLFRLQDDPGLPAVRLPCSPVEVGTELTLIGRGRDRAAGPTYWTVEEGPEDDDDVWTEVQDATVADRIGYGTEPTRSTRWGRNIVDETNFIAGSDRWGAVASYGTKFDSTLDVDSVAHAVTGDSGGPVFQKRDGVWELGGMIYGVDLLDGHPLLTRGAIFGDTSLIADVYVYADEIRAVADFALLGDHNLDGQLDLVDIDFLVAAIADSNHSCHFDLNRNQIVDRKDLTVLLTSMGSLSGDTNLDGEVDFTDFLAISSRFGSEARGWGEGDFDGDGIVSFTDFLVLSDAFGSVFAGQDMVANPVPEPTGGIAWILAVLLLSSRIPRTRR